MISKKYDYVLFDLDGTLLNTNELIIKTFQHTLAEHLQLNESREELYKYFGEPLRDTLFRYDPDKWEEMLITYREFNTANHDKLAEPFPEVIETLEELKKLGIIMGVVTSKLRRGAERGLNLYQINKYFDTLVTYDDTSEHKPSPVPILKAMDILNCRETNVLMVGDSPYDLKSAYNAGIDSIAVSWSVHSLDKLRKEKPTYVIDNMKEIIDIVNG